MKIEQIVLSEKRKVTLTAYLQETGGEFRGLTQRPCILILPGGAYEFCSDREADPVAMPYLKAGYQVCILRYSVKQYASWPQPLLDYEEAITYIRNCAKEWHIDTEKVAVIGFSAGGHLAAAAATMANQRPNAVILGYAVTGEDVKGCNPTAPDTIAEIDDRTPPVFLFASRTDEVVPVINSVKFMEGLIEKDISFESHIYSHGCHAFSTCDPSLETLGSQISSRAVQWVDDSISWLADVMGTCGPEGERLPIVKAHITGDRLPFLSIDCTIGCIAESPEGNKIFQEFMSSADHAPKAENAEKEPKNKMEIMKHIPFRNMLSVMKVSDEIKEELDKKLSHIPNSRVKQEVK